VIRTLIWSIAVSSTLLNGSHNIDATFEVVVDARKPTKLIRDFMPAEP
jgi:hypothetical protein